jgi:hypothetical protein
MAIDPVFFQAAATIVAGQIQARAIKSSAPNRSVLSVGLSVGDELVQTYRDLRRAAQLIAAEDAKAQPASSMTISDPTA